MVTEQKPISPDVGEKTAAALAICSHSIDFEQQIKA